MTIFFIGAMVLTIICLHDCLRPGFQAHGA